MLRTREDIKKAILDYLGGLTDKTGQLEKYTLPKISEVVQAEISKVEEALSELEEEGVVDSRKVQLDVYVPQNQNGFQVLSIFAKKGYVFYSPYWAVFFGFALLFIGFSVWGNSLSLPAETETLFDSYLMGIRHGIMGSFVAGLLGGMFFQNMLSGFRRWQIIAEEDYKNISNVFKYSIYIFFALGVSYYIGSNQFGYPLESAVIIGLLGISVASAFSYEHIRSRRKTAQNDRNR